MAYGRLLIVSHTPHYRKENRVVGWGATVQEIDILARLFDEVVHVAPLHREEAPPESAQPYRAAHVRLRAVPPSGGARFADKIRILRFFSSYARAIRQEARRADAVHVRCPASIGLLALVLLTLWRRPRKRWIKYAGNWQGYAGEPWSYAVQRWWLKKRWVRAEVTVNGRWPDQPGHVHTFLNPCLTEEELAAARNLASDKRLAAPVRLLFVGQLVRAKGVYQALSVVAALRDRGIPAVLDFVGDGRARSDLERQAAASGIRERVRFHGWQPRSSLAAHYTAAHLMVFPSRSEGWPKVLSEAMAYGVVPLAGRVGSIPQYLDAFGTGRALEPEDTDAFAEAVAWYLAHPEAWKKESSKGVAAAQRFSYARYLEAVRRLFARQERNDTAASNVQEHLWAEAIGEEK